jgi:hypothetical protein
MHRRQEHRQADRNAWIAGAAAALVLSAPGCTLDDVWRPMVDGGFGDTPRTDGPLGVGGVSATGGVAGTGGRRAEGGARGEGGRHGEGGARGEGGRTGAGGAAADAGPEASGCGPVCAIYCPNGNVLDERGCPTCSCKPPSCPQIRCEDNKCKHGYANDANGCPTCTCNPKPGCKPVTCKLACPDGFATDDQGCEICMCKPPAACTTADCTGPAPGAPNVMCSDGSIGGPVCDRVAGGDGKCVWQIRSCPEPPAPECAGAITAVTCNLAPRCRWLEPGCTEPKLTAAGCYPRAQIDCDQTGHACPAGTTCQERSVNPCPSVLPLPGICSACGELLHLCL